ncbi:M20 family metallo-hydrolase [Mesorhizobium hawassense]|nr:M20 family metallo-hydrolase [Mesorhizobium hawassense]
MALGCVEANRFLASVERLATFGLRADGGVERQALSEQEIEARKFLIGRARALGCKVEIDPCGNLFFTRAGAKLVPPVVMGSHIDTQPMGGRLDGAYGVLAGFEVLAALDDASIETSRPVTVVAWTNEEGSRFKPGAMGSGAFVEPSLLEHYQHAVGVDGVIFGEALAEARSAIEGALDCAPGFAMHAYLEAHIEQGPVLEQSGHSLAVVTGIQGVRWYEVRCQGCAAHAGTTPMSMRRDAVVLANNYLKRIVDLSGELSAQDIRITCGRWNVTPNSINTIASEALFTLDVRSPNYAGLDRFEATLEAERNMVENQALITIDRILEKAPTAFDERLQTLLARACQAATGTDPIRIMSGAFHDALHLAGHCPTAMIFVPSIGGVSHNPAEATQPDDLVLGVQALAYAVTSLAI